MREQFSRFVGPVIDKVLGLRCTSYGYQYSEIAGSLASVYFCGGNCVEDITSHLMPHLSLHPSLRTCSSDTVLRAISELATGNTTYTSDTGKSYEFNTATKLNSLLVKALLSTGQLVAGASYDLDFDHQFIETEKYDAKMTYKGSPSEKSRRMVRSLKMSAAAEYMQVASSSALVLPGEV